MNLQTKDRIPDFLVIGAMKAGTTALCDDLGRNPSVFIPSVKEPHFLADEYVLSPAGRRSYAKLFAKSNASQVCGEGSTGYTKLPDHDGVPGRAKRLLGANARFVYLVRNPVHRAISHHFHLFRAGDVSPDIDRAVREVPQLIDYGRYAKQLEPWIDQFGRESILVVRFEDYVAQRLETIADISRFLGVAPRTDLIDLNIIPNRGATALSPKPVIKSLLRSVTHSRWYKTHVHPHTPVGLKNALKPIFFAKPAEHPTHPSLDSIKRIVGQVSDDADRLRVIMGRKQPLWDLGQTISSSVDAKVSHS